MLELLVLLVVGWLALMFALWFALAILGALADGWRRLNQGPPKPMPKLPAGYYERYAERHTSDWDDDDTGV